MTGEAFRFSRGQFAFWLARRRRVAEAVCGETELQTAGVVQELPVSSGELEDSPAGGSEGGASSVGVVPASGLHRNEPDPAEPAGVYF